MRGTRHLHSEKEGDWTSLMTPMKLNMHTIYFQVMSTLLGG